MPHKSCVFGPLLLCFVFGCSLCILFLFFTIVIAYSQQLVSEILVRFMGFLVGES